MEPDAEKESDTTSSNTGWRLLWWGTLMVALFGLAVYDIFPLLAQPHKLRVARELAARGVSLSDFRTTLKANGVEVISINNMNAVLIQYAPRRSFIHKGIVAINEQIESSGWKIPLMPHSRIIFLSSLDDSTTIPASSL